MKAGTSQAKKSLPMHHLVWDAGIAFAVPGRSVQGVGFFEPIFGK
jgi:hypothetical protein